MKFLKYHLIIFISLLLFVNGIPNYYFCVNTNGIPYAYNFDNGRITAQNCIVWCVYENKIYNNGWAQMEITTNASRPAKEQAYFAGFIEGYVSGELIGYHWRNLHGTYCSSDTQFCQTLRQFINDNRNYVNRMINNNLNDIYWDQVNLIYTQLDGITQGYKLWEKENNNGQMNGYDAIDIIIMNLIHEIKTLKVAYGRVSNAPDQQNDIHLGSAIVKVLPDGSDLLIGHNTWDQYNTMLRIVKRYNFNFRDRNTGQLIQGNTVSFSSYPGLVFSADNFYMTSSGLAIQSNSISNSNNNLWRNIRSDGMVFEFIRNIVANRLATTGDQWTNIYSRYNSGTHNNQYMVIDYKRFNGQLRPEQLSDGLLWIIEQLPGYFRRADITGLLRNKYYHSSYNIPYFPDVFDSSNGRETVRMYGPYFHYNQTARGMNFFRDQGRITDISVLYKTMRYNNYASDPYSKCRTYSKVCSPPFNAHLAIAGRNDLNDQRGIYPFRNWNYDSRGAIDAKVMNRALVTKFEMFIVNGPTNLQYQSFQWSRSAFNGQRRHEGHPDLFNFDPVYVQWYPKPTTTTPAATQSQQPQQSQLPKPIEDAVKQIKDALKKIEKPKNGDDNHK